MHESAERVSDGCARVRTDCSSRRRRGVPFDVSIVIGSGRRPETIVLKSKVGRQNPFMSPGVRAVTSATRPLFHASAAFLGAGPRIL